MFCLERTIVSSNAERVMEIEGDGKRQAEVEDRGCDVGDNFDEMWSELTR